MDAIFQIIGVVIEYLFRGLGLWVLKVVTLGRYRDTNSYLYFLPNLIGFLAFTLLLIAGLGVIGALQRLA